MMTHDDSLWRILQIQPSLDSSPNPDPAFPCQGSFGSPDQDWRKSILSPLDEFSREKGFIWNPVPLVLGLFESKEGDSVSLSQGPFRPKGGLIGQLHWNWLRIEILSVPKEIRGQGWGRRLVEWAESIAGKQGCHKAWVDTFSFQSPGFYEKMGYRLFGQLEDYPPGQKRQFYSKDLVSSP